AVARELGIGDDLIRKALAGFAGVKRRFTRTGEWNGIPIIDDYGHHPIEIAAVLRAARASTGGQVIAIVQPHRYSRLASPAPIATPWCWACAPTGIARRSRLMVPATLPAWCGGSRALATSWCFSPPDP